nr:MAG TPA: hypothetical protein [Caudoviricetes sp.]
MGALRQLRIKRILLSGGALVSARLCRLPEQEVHQPSMNVLSACEI